jgi:hypothetical protein
MIKADKHRALDVGTATVDILLLDVLGNIQALLAGAQEVQRQLLRVRGVPEQVTQPQRLAAAVTVRNTVLRMDGETGELSQGLKKLKKAVDVLETAVKNR